MRDQHAEQSTGLLMSGSVERVALDVHLRSQHIEFVKHLAERAHEPIEPEKFSIYVNDFTESYVITKLIEHAKQKDASEKSEPSRKVRKHFSVKASDVEFLDRLCTKWGIKRSQVIQRLIEQAQADGFRLEAFEATAALGFGS